MKTSLYITAAALLGASLLTLFLALQHLLPATHQEQLWLENARWWQDLAAQQNQMATWDAHLPARPLSSHDAVQAARRQQYLDESARQRQLAQDSRSQRLLRAARPAGLALALALAGLALAGYVRFYFDRAIKTGRLPA